MTEDEILDMIVDPGDDLSLRKEDTGRFCDKFSYEYSFYIANASGPKPLEKCFEQFNNMEAFDNSWYYTVKLWQAPGEHVSAEDLRMFYRSLMRQRVIGTPVFAVGHDDTLKSGEVRMLLATNYNERCFPPAWEFEWADKCRKLPITELCKEVPALKEHIEQDVFVEYREAVLHGLVKYRLEELEYDEGIDWQETLSALDYFLKLGSNVKNALYAFTSKAGSAASAGQFKKTKFFLLACQWAIEQGANINAAQSDKTVLDHLNDILALDLDETSKGLACTLRDELVAKGAVTYAERVSNMDYFKELEYLNA